MACPLNLSLGYAHVFFFVALGLVGVFFPPFKVWPFVYFFLLI